MRNWIFAIAVCLLCCGVGSACEQPQAVYVYRQPAPVVQAAGFVGRVITWPFRPTYYVVPVYQQQGPSK